MSGIDLEQIADLISASSETIKGTVLAAYERGLVDGRQIASEQFKERLAFVLKDEPQTSSGKIAPHGPLPDVPLTPPSPAPRAARGSVEPIVFGALPETGRGKRPADIAAETGLPENSVRGKLNKLRHAGRVQKTGEYWIKVSAPATAGNGNPGAESAGESQSSR